MRGRVVPRIWTPPLRDLDDPASSYGYELAEFADRIDWPLDPWQRWLAIHMGELLPDGRPRFRMVLVLVARQNGKTLLTRLLTLYWLFVEIPHLYDGLDKPVVLGTHTSRDYAKKSWKAVIDMAKNTPMLERHIGRKAVTLQVGEEEFRTLRGAAYMFSATNRRAGRGLTVGRNVLDELREHRDWEAYRASINAMNAVDDAQAVAITNQGDDRGVVLDSLRGSALDFIETGQGDHRLGLFEWSAPAGADPTDPEALAMANPDLGNRIQLDALMGDAIRAKAEGGAVLAGFRTEVLCQRVDLLDPAIDPEKWTACQAVEPVDLAAHRRRVAVCLDVSLDGSHATLVAAATIGGVTHIEALQTWHGYGCTAAVRRDMPVILAKVRPRVVGWFPGGPAAAIAAALGGRDRSDPRAPWPPRAATVREIGAADVVPVCMGFAEQVATLEVRHAGDALLSQHAKQTQRLKRGDGWVFTRRGSGPVDGTYAMAGAVHLARTMPAALPPLEVV